MIVVGVAPGGFISVWLKGIDKTTEIFTGVAVKTQIPWENVVSTNKYSREGYIALVLESEIGQDGIKKIYENGVPQGLWEQYRKRYLWTPVVTGVSMPKVINSIRFFNGERDYFSKSYDNDWSNEPKAVPSSMHFVWKHKQNIAFSVGVDFDEVEIMQAFEEISKKSNQPIELNIDIQQVDQKLSYSFILRSGSESIKLKKGKLEHFRAAMTDERLEKFLKEN